MSVKNCKVKYIRAEGYKDLKDWVNDPNNVYIARRGVVFVDGQRFPPRDSKFANPFKIGRDGDRATVLKKYRRWLEQSFLSGQITVEDLWTLRGKNLGCWCKPDRCHGDILIELINCLFG